MGIDLLQYTSTIKAIASKFPKHYHNDLINEAYLSIYDAQETYNPDKGEFKTYVKKFIYFAMVRFTEVDKQTNSLDATIIDVEGETTTWAELLEDEVDTEAMLGDIDYLDKHMATLNQKERFIKRKYYVDNLSVEEIVYLFGHWTGLNDKKSIYKIINKK